MTTKSMTATAVGAGAAAAVSGNGTAIAISAGGLNALRDEALRIATEHGFKDASVGEDIALMHSELSEALEDHRTGKLPADVWYELKDGRAFNTLDAVQDAGYAELDGKPCGIPSEMADTMIRILHFCGKHKIDIARAVAEKMRYNDSRPMKHGGKVL